MQKSSPPLKKLSTLAKESLKIEIELSKYIQALRTASLFHISSKTKQIIQKR